MSDKAENRISFTQKLVDGLVLFLSVIIIGALCGKAVISLGILPEEYYIICVITGICAFLAACSKTPLMALAFCMEALDGTANLIPVAIGITVAYMSVETLGIHDFTDIVIDSKLRKAIKENITATVIIVAQRVGTIIDADKSKYRKSQGNR